MYAAPTVNSSVALGDVIVTVGAVLPELMATVAAAEIAPAESRTRSVAVQLPAA